MESIDDKIEQMESLCRDQGMRVTVQKRRILEVLLKHGDHPSADDVFEEVQQTIPNVSRTTVYRVLETLNDLGLVNKVYHPNDEYRFDPNTGHHHHLICEECSTVRDVDATELQALEEVADFDFQNFEVRDYSVYFQGRCMNCREESPEVQ